MGMLILMDLMEKFSQMFSRVYSNCYGLNCIRWISRCSKLSESCISAVKLTMPLPVTCFKPEILMLLKQSSLLIVFANNCLWWSGGGVNIT